MTGLTLSLISETDPGDSGVVQWDLDPDTAISNS